MKNSKIHKIRGMISALSLSVFLLSHACVAKIPSADKIVGGDADALTYPGVVRLHFSDDMQKNNKWCSGSVVAGDLVLTSAHCYLEPPSTMQVEAYMGPVGSEVTVKATDYVIFPGYVFADDGSQQGNEQPATDVAFAVFPAGSFSPDKVMALSHEQPMVGEVVQLVGYGEANVGDPNSTARRIGSNSVFGFLPAFASVILVQSLSATTAAPSPGDSGSPLLSLDGAKIYGICHGAATRAMRNSDISPSEPDVGLYVNVNDAGISQFIREVLAATPPNSKTAQDVAATKVPVYSSSSDFNHLAIGNWLSAMP